MLTIPYTDRDYESIFNDVKNIIEIIEPRAEVGIDKANIESIISRVVAGTVDTLSYNQDANILEAFPSTATNPRAVFDLLSIVGYTPRTARCCHVSMALWNPSFIGEYNYAPYNSIQIDNKTFYCPDSFRCAQGITTYIDWYQGSLVSPDHRPQEQEVVEDNFLVNYYPNLSINVIRNNLYKLPEEHTLIDSKTIRIYSEDGKELTYVENPYLTNITKSSFSLLPTVNSNGYSLMFSRDVSSGALGENFYYFYVMSGRSNVSKGLDPNFSDLSVNNNIPSFSFSYSVEEYKDPETAREARENIAYEFGWRDTPKAIITKYDAERAVLQNFEYIAAVDVRDGNDYSKCDPSLFDVQIFCKVNEEYETKLNTAVADGLKNRLMTHFSKFKMLPLNFTFHIDNIQTEENENLTHMYFWYPDITIYLKEKVDSQGAAAILNAVHSALYERFSTINTNFNEVPRIVDIIEAVQNSSDIILYLDIDGVYYVDVKSGEEAVKEDITCAFTETLPITTDETDYTVTLNTKNGERPIQFHTIKIVNSTNEVVAYDNGDGTIISYSPYFDGHGEINYATGELHFVLNGALANTEHLQIYYKQEQPTFCEYVSVTGGKGIKIALESLGK